MQLHIAFKASYNDILFSRVISLNLWTSPLYKPQSLARQISRLNVYWIHRLCISVHQMHYKPFKLISGSGQTFISFNNPQIHLWNFFQDASQKNQDPLTLVNQIITLVGQIKPLTSMLVASSYLCSNLRLRAAHVFNPRHFMDTSKCLLSYWCLSQLLFFKITLTQMFNVGCSLENYSTTLKPL